jgi:hypothetical protein
VLNTMQAQHPTQVQMFMGSVGKPQQMIVSIQGPPGKPGHSYTYNWVDPWFERPYYQLVKVQDEASPGDMAMSINEANALNADRPHQFTLWAGGIGTTVAAAPIVLPALGMGAVWSAMTPEVAYAADGTIIYLSPSIPEILCAPFVAVGCSTEYATAFLSPAILVRLPMAIEFLGNFCDPACSASVGSVCGMLWFTYVWPWL